MRLSHAACASSAVRARVPSSALPSLKKTRSPTWVWNSARPPRGTSELHALLRPRRRRQMQKRHSRERRNRPTASGRTLKRAPRSPVPCERQDCAGIGAKLWLARAVATIRRLAAEAAEDRSGARFVAAVEHRLGAAILRPAGDVVAHRHGPLLAVGDRADALGVDAVLGQEVAHRRGALGAERDVVLARAALVGVALDGDGVLRVLLQPARLVGERLLRFRRQIDGVGREVDDIADVDGEITRRAGVAGLLRPPPARFRAWAYRSRRSPRTRPDGDRGKARPGLAPPRQLHTLTPSFLRCFAGSPPRNIGLAQSSSRSFVRKYDRPPAIEKRGRRAANGNTAAPVFPAMHTYR